jgi:hypothetical protein
LFIRVEAALPEAGSADGGAIGAGKITSEY